MENKLEQIISEKEYNKLVCNNYKQILLNDYELNFIINSLKEKFSGRYDDKFLFLYNKLEKIRNNN